MGQVAVSIREVWLEFQSSAIRCNGFWDVSRILTNTKWSQIKVTKAVMEYTLTKTEKALSLPYGWKPDCCEHQRRQG